MAKNASGMSEHKKFITKPEAYIPIRSLGAQTMGGMRDRDLNIQIQTKSIHSCGLQSALDKLRKTSLSASVQSIPQNFFGSVHIHSFFLTKYSMQFLPLYTF